MRVTDLETFAEEEIWSPYWPMHPDADQTSRGPERYREGLKRMGIRRHSLDDTLLHLRELPNFRERVINRLGAIGIVFPAYVQHPLADYIKEQIQEWRKTNDDTDQPAERHA